MSLDDIDKALIRIVETLTLIVGIVIWIATLPLVMIYLFFRYRVEKKLREENKI